MSYVVDTDVLSRASPIAGTSVPGLGEWLDRNSEHLHVSVVSVMEISYGIAWLRHGKARRKADLLQAWLDDVVAFHKDRIMVVGDDTAVRAGQLMARARASGVEVSAEDVLIAATADLAEMTALTANARHFAPMRIRYADVLDSLPPDLRR